MGPVLPTRRFAGREAPTNGVEDAVHREDVEVLPETQAARLAFRLVLAKPDPLGGSRDSHRCGRSATPFGAPRLQGIHLVFSCGTAASIGGAGAIPWGAVRGARGRGGEPTAHVRTDGIEVRARHSIGPGIDSGVVYPRGRRAC